MAVTFTSRAFVFFINTHPTRAYILFCDATRVHMFYFLINTSHDCTGQLLALNTF